MDKEQIITKASMLLKKIKIYSPSKYFKYICEFFDDTRYDMQLHIDINDSQYRLFAYERGVLVYEYKTKDDDEIIFSILDTIIRTIAKDETYKMCADEKGCIYYTQEVRSYSKVLNDLFFSMIGGKYNIMHQQGKNAML